MEQRTGLYRSQTDRVIGGVCGGIGKALNIDPTILRIVFIVLVLAGGSGGLIYIILWIALPEEYPAYFTSTSNSENMEQNKNSEQQKPDYRPKPKSDGNLVGGLILITLGAIFLLDRFLPRIDFGDLWPLLLVAAGAALIFMSYNKPKPKDHE